MAFRHGKIHCKEVEPWLQTHKPEIDPDSLPAKEDVQVLNLLEDLKAKRFKNMQAEDKFLERDKVISMLTAISYKQRAILIQGLRNELPPQLEGLRAPEMVALMDQMIDRIITCWREMEVPIPDENQESPAGEIHKTLSQSSWNYT